MAERRQPLQAHAVHFGTLNPGGEKTMDDKILNELIDSLATENWEARKRSAEQLVRMGPDMVPRLITALSSNKNEDIRYWIIRVLGDINDPRGIQAILKVLGAKSRDFRAYAASALKNSSNQKIIECLIGCLEDEHWRVAEAAAASLENIGAPATAPLVEKLKKCSDNVAYWIVRILSRSTLDTLVKFIRFDNKNIQLLITEALADSQDPRSTAILLEFLGGKYWDVRQNAVEALVKQGERVVIPLIAYLKNKEAEVYYWAEKVIESINIVHMNPILKLLDSEDRDIRILAARIIGKTGNPLAIKPLVNALNDRCWFVAKSAANALIEAGKDCMDEILAILRDENAADNVRYWAATILSRMGDDAISILIENLRTGDKGLRKLSAQALGVVKPPQALEPLIQALNDISWPVRNVAASSVIQYGGTITRTISKYLMDRNENIRLWTRRIIGEIGKEYTDEFRETLKGAKDSESRSCAAVALGVLNASQALPDLLNTMFNDNDTWVRRYAASAVGDIGEMSTLPRVMELLQDPNPEIKVWASEVLAKFGPQGVEVFKEYVAETDRTEEKLLLSMTLAEMGDKTFFPQLVKVMKADDIIRSQRAIRAAVNCGTEMIPVLIESLKEENQNLRNNVVKALTTFGPKALPLLQEAQEKVKDKNQLFWIDKALREIAKK